MSEPRGLLPVSSAALAALLLCAAASQLTGCVVRAGVAVPVAPPPAVYVAPPPAAEPVAGADAQASEPPPPLPVYAQPACPVAGYLWTPGYWAWAPAGYYWVPGTWVAPPRVGLLWTPGYWGFVGGVYMFHAGFWGPHVGFYGGVNYGFGYGGVGFAGGRWAGNTFAYNQSVTNVNVTVVHNTYNETVINNNVTVNRVSYNGGAGGTTVVPSPQERMAAQEQHVPATAAQNQHMQQARANPGLLAKNNGGHPAIAATPRPGAFSGPGVVGARGAAAHATPAAYANQAHGKANGAHAPYAAAHSQPHGSGKQQPVKANAKAHPKNPDSAKRQNETAQR